mmetsp:Transcript_121667/g.378712  ORF Transcript_121667/g.378712 Transcript_121667/m.378712 type:complete len:315 (+) Transcript_121667:1385-2329(+)
MPSKHDEAYKPSFHGRLEAALDLGVRVGVAPELTSAVVNFPIQGVHQPEAPDPPRRLSVSVPLHQQAADPVHPGQVERHPLSAGVLRGNPRKRRVQHRACVPRSRSAVLEDAAVGPAFLDRVCGGAREATLCGATEAGDAGAGAAAPALGRQGGIQDGGVRGGGRPGSQARKALVRGLLAGALSAACGNHLVLWALRVIELPEADGDHLLLVQLRKWHPDVDVDPLVAGLLRRLCLLRAGLCQGVGGPQRLPGALPGQRHQPAQWHLAPVHARQLFGHARPVTAEQVRLAHQEGVAAGRGLTDLLLLAGLAPDR